MNTTMKAADGKNARGRDLGAAMMAARPTPQHDSDRGGAVHHNIFFSTHNALQEAKQSEYTIKLAISERNGSRHLVMSVYPFHDVELVKHMLIRTLGLPKQTNVRDICIYYGGSELPNRRLLNPFATQRRFVNMQWEFRDRNPEMGVRESGLTPPQELSVLIEHIQLSFKRGIKPKLVHDGTGGTYMMYDAQRRCIAIFKPQDEEPFAPNNPRDHVGVLGTPGLRSGVVSGEGAVREVAAALLDSQHDYFCGVPPTAKVEACHRGFNYAFCYDSINTVSGGRSTLSGLRPIDADKDKLWWKEGSLQKYISSAESCADYDPSLYSISDVQRIAILDIRVMNLDRNDGNLLVQRLNRSYDLGSLPRGPLTPLGKPTKYRLIPIDHGLILPDAMGVNEMDLVWLQWPHVKLETEEDELFYIFTLEPDKDARRLVRKLNIRSECLRTMRATTRLLQIGSRMRLNLHQIAIFMCRQWEDEQPSELENVVKLSITQAYTYWSGLSGARAAAGLGLDMSMDLAVHDYETMMYRKDVKLPTSDFCCPPLNDSSNRTPASGDQGNNPLSFSRLWESSGHCANSAQSKEKDVTTPSAVNGSTPAAGSQIGSTKKTSEVRGRDSESSRVDSDDGAYDSNPTLYSKLSGAPLSRGAELELLQEASASDDSDRPDAPSQRPKRTIRATRGTARTLVASTAARQPNSQQTHLSTWMLLDSQGYVVPLDWDDKAFDRMFFDIFESHLKHQLREKFRDWKTFPYKGKRVEEEICMLLQRRTGRRGH